MGIAFHIAYLLHSLHTTNIPIELFGQSPFPLLFLVIPMNKLHGVLGFFGLPCPLFLGGESSVSFSTTVVAGGVDLSLLVLEAPSNHHEYERPSLFLGESVSSAVSSLFRSLHSETSPLCKSSQMCSSRCLWNNSSPKLLMKV